MVEDDYEVFVLLQFRFTTGSEILKEPVNDDDYNMALPLCYCFTIWKVGTDAPR